MSTEKLGIIATGVANLASVQAAFKRLGVQTARLNEPREVLDASRVILPGVGAFAPAMNALRERGIDEALRERIEAGRATLGICLGMQLFGLASSESPGVEGLGCIPFESKRFPDDVRVPHFGWNRVEADPNARFLRSGYLYFANSYRVPDSVSERLGDWALARADYGGPFVAAFERGDVLACQFHPELSGAMGSALLGRWLEGTRPQGASKC